MSRLHRCLVVTVDNVPVARISAERAIVLITQDKAYLMHAQGDEVFRSKYTIFPAPAIIGLTEKHPLPEHFYGAARLTGNNLLRRDSWACQYCGIKKGEMAENQFLTRDHVFPVSRGGEDIWENVVIACSRCNNLKSDRTPEEAGMDLLKLPHAPARWELHKRFVDMLLASNTVTPELQEFLEDTSEDTMFAGSNV